MLNLDSMLAMQIYQLKIKTSLNQSFSSGKRQYMKPARPMKRALNAKISKHLRKKKRQEETPTDSTLKMPKQEKHLLKQVNQKLLLRKLHLLPHSWNLTSQLLDLVKKELTALEKLQPVVNPNAVESQLQKVTQSVLLMVNLKTFVSTAPPRNTQMDLEENTLISVTEPRPFLLQHLPLLLPYTLCETGLFIIHAFKYYNLALNNKK